MSQPHLSEETGWSADADRALVRMLPQIEQALSLLPQLAQGQAVLTERIEARNKLVDNQLRGLEGRLDAHSAALGRDLVRLTSVSRDLAALTKRVDSHNGTVDVTDEQQLELATMHVEIKHLREACDKMDALDETQQKLERTQYLLGLAIVVFSLFGPDIGTAITTTAGALLGGVL